MYKRQAIEEKRVGAYVKAQSPDLLRELKELGQGISPAGINAVRELFAGDADMQTLGVLLSVLSLGGGAALVGRAGFGAAARAFAKYKHKIPPGMASKAGAWFMRHARQFRDKATRQGREQRRNFDRGDFFDNPGQTPD